MQEQKKRPVRLQNKNTRTNPGKLKGSKLKTGKKGGLSAPIDAHPKEKLEEPKSQLAPRLLLEDEEEEEDGEEAPAQGEGPLTAAVEPAGEPDEARTPPISPREAARPQAERLRTASHRLPPAPCECAKLGATPRSTL